MHHLLQALSRASVRQGNGSDCGPCNAYIIAPKRAQMRRLLPKVFPNCIIRRWRPTGKKPKGKVQDALSYIEMHFDDYPDEVLTFKELQAELSITPSSNFRNSIRKHPCFRYGLEALGIAEVTIGNRRHRNALARISAFGPVVECTKAT